MQYKQGPTIHSEKIPYIVPKTNHTISDSTENASSSSSIRFISSNIFLTRLKWGRASGTDRDNLWRDQGSYSRSDRRDWLICSYHFPPAIPQTVLRQYSIVEPQQLKQSMQRIIILIDRSIFITPLSTKEIDDQINNRFDHARADRGWKPNHSHFFPSL